MSDSGIKRTGPQGHSPATSGAQEGTSSLPYQGYVSVITVLMTVVI